MTSPRLAVDSPFGRLYAHPDTRDLLTGDPEKDLSAGYLVPSVTNVIGILEKPHLYDWYARKATEAAMDVTFQHPGLITRKPSEARKWLSGAAKRHMNDAADLGTSVHSICESLANGEEDVVVGERERPYVEAWYKFAEAFSPEYLHVESTVFGRTDPGKEETGYAGTADFFARIGELTVVGDLKTGRSIHTEAAIQLNALAHAEELIDDNDNVLAVPAADLGLVVHLGKGDFSVRVAPLTDEARGIFVKLRSLWDFHAVNLSSSRALLMSPAITNPQDFRAFTEGI